MGMNWMDLIDRCILAFWKALELMVIQDDD